MNIESAMDRVGEQMQLQQNNNQAHQEVETFEDLLVFKPSASFPEETFNNTEVNIKSSSKNTAMTFECLEELQTEISQPQYENKNFEQQQNPAENGCFSYQHSSSNPGDRLTQESYNPHQVVQNCAFEYQVESKNGSTVQLREQQHYFPMSSQYGQLTQEISVQEPTEHGHHLYPQTSTNLQGNSTQVQWPSSSHVYPTHGTAYSGTGLRGYAHPPPEWHRCPNQQHQEQYNSDRVVQNGFYGQHCNQHSVNTIPSNGWLPSQQQNMYQIEELGRDGKEVAEGAQELKSCRYEQENFVSKPGPANFLQHNQVSMIHNTVNSSKVATGSWINQTSQVNRTNKRTLATTEMQAEPDHRYDKREKLVTFPCIPCRNSFKSLGHLKRHFKTNLHKKAVMFSRQPDPANLPINTDRHPYTESGGDNGFLRPRSGRIENQHFCDGNEAIQDGRMNRTSGGTAYISNESYGWCLAANLEEKVHLTPHNGFPQPQQMNPNNHQRSPHIPYGDASRSFVEPLPEHLQLTATPSKGPTTLVENDMVGHTAPMENTYQLIRTEVEQAATDENPGASRSHRSIHQTEHQQNQVEHNQPLPCYDQLQRESGSHYQAADIGKGIPPMSSSSNDNSGCSNIRNGYISTVYIPATSNDVQVNVIIDNSPGLSGVSQNLGTINSGGPMSASPSQSGMSSSQESSGDRNSGMNEEGKSALASDLPESSVLGGRLYCLVCQKSFSKICYLTQHNRSYHGEAKLYKCSKCGKRFPCETSLGEHQKKHTGVKQNKCSICPKEFVHKIDLTRHIFLHTGNKPHICPICEKDFIRRDQMIKHMARHNKQ